MLGGFLRRRVRRLTRQSEKFIRQSFDVVSSLLFPPKHKGPWVFLFNMNNSGSTAVANLVGTAENAVGLTNNFEGQWLLTATSNNFTRRIVPPNPRVLRAVWLRRAPAGVVIEKSPDNLHHWRCVLGAFKDVPQAKIVMTREPLPNIASWLKRYHQFDMLEDWSGLSPEQALARRRLLVGLSQTYYDRLRILCEIAGVADLVTSYEDICLNPTAFSAQIRKLVPELAPIDIGAKFVVKDYPPQPMVNLNKAATALLCEQDKYEIWSTLRQGVDTLKFFGYDVPKTVSK